MPLLALFKALTNTHTVLNAHTATINIIKICPIYAADPVFALRTALLPIPSNSAFYTCVEE